MYVIVTTCRGRVRVRVRVRVRIRVRVRVRFRFRLRVRPLRHLLEAICLRAGCVDLLAAQRDLRRTALRPPLLQHDRGAGELARAGRKRGASKRMEEVGVRAHQRCERQREAARRHLARLTNGGCRKRTWLRQTSEVRQAHNEARHVVVSVRDRAPARAPSAESLRHALRR